MNKIIVFILFGLIISQTCLAQTDTICLFEEDSSYYYQNELNFIETWRDMDTTSVLYYFQSFGYHYLFNDSLPDGYYKVYDLPRKDSAKVKLEKYLVIEGEFKDKKRNGNFIYKDYIDYGKIAKKSDLFIYENSYIMKIVPFDNGIVNGKVREYSHGILMYAGEYKNGVKNGFFLLQEVGTYAKVNISYYKNGKEIKSVEFNQWE